MKHWQRRNQDAQNARLHGGFAPRMCECGAPSDEHDYESGVPFEGPLSCKKTGCKDFRLKQKENTAA